MSLVIKSSYLPLDRLLALCSGQEVPERAEGVALIADVSGYTALTEALQHKFGARRGAEELSHLMEQVFQTLIHVVTSYGGSVIGFSGDAFLCWFTPRPGLEIAHLAATAAMEMQQSMDQFSALALADGSQSGLGIKIAIAQCRGLRREVGDPAYQVFDVLAGSDITRLAQGEGLASRGETVVDESIAAKLGPYASIGESRSLPQDVGIFLPLLSLESKAQVAPLQIDGPMQDAQLRPYLLPEVNAALDRGQGEFLTELRSAAVLFMRFNGLDYDRDPQAGDKLDYFIRGVQAILRRFGGSLLQLTMGEKGNFLYLNFGAPVAYEDNAQRAAQAALALRQLCEDLDYLEAPQIGLSYGQVRCGAYGGRLRRTYGALGDDVNLAARLMVRAHAGEILTSETFRRQLDGSAKSSFSLEPMAPVRVKGKANPQPVYILNPLRPQRALPLEEPAYVLPLVGRESELNLATQKLDLVLSGQGQVLSLIGEAGIGKSRLAAEIILLALRLGLRGFGGRCQSYASHTPYLVWHTIWGAFFDLDPAQPAALQSAALAEALLSLAPERLATAPLLGQVLNLPLEESAFSLGLEPQERKLALEALLVDCLRSAALEAANTGGGLLVVLEDVHWIDTFSLDLLARLAQLIVNLPVMVLLTHRPLGSDERMSGLNSIQELAQAMSLHLSELPAAAAARLVEARLELLFPGARQALPANLVEQLLERTQGNPFYIEEILNYLHSRGIDPRQAIDAGSWDLPDSLHSLMLSRMDRLDENLKVVLKVASVIGRLFSLTWLKGYYYLNDSSDNLFSDLEQLERLNFTILDQIEPDLTYLFKHGVTRDVAYESMPFAMRQQLHEQIAAYLEGIESGDQLLDLITYHYDHSANLGQRRRYLRRAGEAARQRYANQAALDYLNRALHLAPKNEPDEIYILLGLREEVFSRLGQRQGQRTDLQRMAELADQGADPIWQAQVALRLGKLAQDISDYPVAEKHARQAIDVAQTHPDVLEATPSLLADAYLIWGRARSLQGDAEQARQCQEQALAVARHYGQWHAESRALNALGVQDWNQGDFPLAKSRLTESLVLAREHGDLRRERAALQNLGVVASSEMDYAAARSYYEQAQSLAHLTGDRMGESDLLGNLSEAALRSGAFTRARQTAQQMLEIATEINDLQGRCVALTNLGESYREVGAYGSATSFARQALEQARAIQYRRGECIVLQNLARLSLAAGNLSEAVSLADDALMIAVQIGSRYNQATASLLTGEIALESGEAQAARRIYQDALEVWMELEDPIGVVQAQLGLALSSNALGLELPEGIQEMLELLSAPQDEMDRQIAEHLPLKDYLAAIKILHVGADKRVGTLMRRAQDELTRRALQIEDPEMRLTFLETITEHRTVAKLV